MEAWTFYNKIIGYAESDDVSVKVSWFLGCVSPLFLKIKQIFSGE